MQKELMKLRSSEVYVYLNKIESLRREINEIKDYVQRAVLISHSSATIRESSDAESEAFVREVKAVKKERSEKVSSIEIEVLKIISEKGEVTSSELTSFLGRSREHISRLLKSLYEKGYLERIENTKPFRYRISDSKREEVQELIR